MGRCKETSTHPDRETTDPRNKPIHIHGLMGLLGLLIRMLMRISYSMVSDTYKSTDMSSVVVHVFNSSTQEAETG